MKEKSMEDLGVWKSCNPPVPQPTFEYDLNGFSYLRGANGCLYRRFTGKNAGWAVFVQTPQDEGE